MMTLFSILVPLLSANRVMLPISLCRSLRISCSTSAFPRPWPWRHKRHNDKFC